MKYLFLLSNKIVCYSKYNFNRNKEELDILIEKYKTKKEIWNFKKAITICKLCMFTLINQPNFFQVIKTLFLKKEIIQNSNYKSNDNDGKKLKTKNNILINKN